MLSWLDWAAGIEGVLAGGLAVFLLVRGVRKPATWVLSLLILGFATISLVIEIPRVLIEFKLLDGPDIPPEASLAWFVARCLFISLNLAFAIVYPDLTLSRGKREALLVAFVPGLLLAIAILSNPRLVLTDDSTPTFFARLIALLVIVSPLPALWVFGTNWVRLEAGAYRNQFFYVLVPYLLWNVNDAVSTLVRTSYRPERFGDALVPLALVFALVQLLLVARVGLSALRRWTVDVPGAPPGPIHVREEEPVNLDRRLVLLLVAGAGVSFLQFIGTGGHLFVDGLVIPILFYGVAKYQILEIDLTLKWGIRGSVLGSAMILVLVPVEQLVSAFAGAPFGFAVGLIVAIVIAIAFIPLHRLAERVSDRAMPDVKRSEAYLRNRRLEIYRAALEGTVRDRRVDPREARALAALRLQLGITQAEHDGLERTLGVLPQPRFRKAVVVSRP